MIAKASSYHALFLCLVVGPLLAGCSSPLSPSRIFHFRSEEPGARRPHLCFVAGVPGANLAGQHVPRSSTSDARCRSIVCGQRAIGPARLSVSMAAAAGSRKKPGGGTGGGLDDGVKQAVPTASAGAEIVELGDFVGLVQSSIDKGTFVKASLGSNSGHNTELKNVFFRLVALKRGIFLQALFRYKTNDQSKNHALPESGEVFRGLIGDGFQQCSLFTTYGDYSLASKQGKLTLTKSPGPPSFTSVDIEGNDRKKNVPIEASSDFLQELGVSNKDGKPKPGMQDKLRQIQKFVSIVDNLVDSAGLKEGGANRDKEKPLRVVDMGCGKGYLTFATHVHLSKSRGINVRTEGVELRRDLVDKTNTIAQKLSLGPSTEDGSGLIFREGYISEHSDRFEDQKLDVLIALHACDTATDDAILCGVKSGASVIIVAPCCHKQIRRQIETNKGGQKTGVLKDLFRHGILRERESESVTDSIRALLLEIEGYTTNVFEFIGGEHTAKNTMIAAVKHSSREKVDVDALRTRLSDLMAFYGIREQHLERHLAARVGEAPSSGVDGGPAAAAGVAKRGPGKTVKLV